MNISPASYKTNFAFKQRIKMKPVNTEKLVKSAILVSGISSISAGMASSDIISGPSIYENPSANSVLSPEFIASTKESLIQQYVPEGIPVQSSAVPSALTYSGVKSFNIAKKIDTTDKNIPS